MSRHSLMSNLFNREKQAPDLFNTMQTEIENVISRFRDFDAFSGDEKWPLMDNGKMTLIPKLDLSETENTIELELELPGVERSNVDVQVINEMLVIEGHKETEVETKDKDRHIVERSSGQFRRQIPLGFDVDADKVTADFRNGVLSVVVEKPPEQVRKARKIEVKESAAA